MSNFGYIQASFLFPTAKTGKMKVYIAGGLTPAILYDPNNGNPISNVLDIDSNGYVRPFWVESSTVYDIYVFDSKNNTVDTIENVSVVGGSSGTPGTDGSSVFLTVNPDGSATITDDYGKTVTIRNGTNGANGTNGSDGVDGVSLISIVVDESSDTGKILYNKTDDPSKFIEAGSVVPSGIGKVKVSNTDTNGYLNDKIVAGDGISVVKQADQPVEIHNAAPETFKTQASQYSTLTGFLNTMLQAGTGIDLQVTPDFNAIKIMSTGTSVGGFLWKGVWDNAVAYNVNNAVWYFDSTSNPPINRLYIATAANQGINPYLDTAGTAWSTMIVIDSLGDEFVKLDINDTTTGYIADKIKQGNGVTLTRMVSGTSAYYQIDGLTLGSTASTAHRGDHGAAAYTHSQTSGNPHNTTIANITGLQTALDAKMSTASYPDLTAIEALAGTSGLLKKTAANTWALDQTTYASDSDVVHKSGSNSQEQVVAGQITAGNLSAKDPGTQESIDILSNAIGHKKADGSQGSSIVMVNNEIQLSGTVKLHNDTIGSASLPIYKNGGYLTACSNTLGVSITGNAATASKVGTSSVGSESQPMYLNAGVPTAITGAIANSTTGNAATASKLGTASVGSASKPIYLNAGAPVAITGAIANSTTGNAATATKLATARSIGFTGFVTGSANFDGSANVSITTADAYSFNWYQASSTYGNWLTKVASWTPEGGTSYEIEFDFSFIGSDFPWSNTAFSATIGYRDGTWTYYPTMKGQHDGYSRFYYGVNGGVCEIWAYTYGNWPRAIGKMVHQSHQFMYNPTGTWTSTIASYLTSSSWTKNVMVGSYSDRPIIIQVQSLATARNNADTIYFCT